MRNILAAACAVTSLLAASSVFACGAAPSRNTPGYAGIAVAEAGNQVSVFTASSTGYSWDRLQLPSPARTHVAAVTGTIANSVETDARVNTAIAGQGEQVVQLSASGSAPLSTVAEAQTTVFGAALDEKKAWQVLTYQPGTQTLALFSETSPGTFAEVGTLHADCGAATMLDVAIESGGSLEGLCAGHVVEVASGTLVLTKLPADAFALSRASTGAAVAYGTAANGTDVVRMTHSADGWTQDAAIASSDVPVSAIAIDETSVVVKTAAAYTAYTLVNGTWRTSAALDPLTPVTTAAGSPAQILSGTYDLTLNTNDGTKDAAWKTTDLGSIGVAPTLGGVSRDPGGAEGCSSGVGSSGWALVVMGLFTFARLGSRSRRLA